MRKKLLTIISMCALCNLYAQPGTLDMSFGTNGTVVTISTDEAFDMIIQPDDKIIMVGMYSGNMAIVRYNSDGSLDNSFGTGGIVTVDFNGGNDAAMAVTRQADGKIVVAGSAQQSSANNNKDLAIVRLNSNGTLDNTFGSGGKFQMDVDGYTFDELLDVEIQSDGKIVAVGKAGTDMFNKNAIIRLNSNGTLDNSFDSDGILKAFSFPGGFMSSLYSLSIQSDGKIVLGGSGTDLRIAGIKHNGTIDNSFGTSGGASISETIHSCKTSIQSDGKIYVTYSFVTFTNTAIARFNSNGTLDNTFGTNGIVKTSINPNQYTYSNGLFLEPSGSILLVGSAYINSTTSDFLLIKYNNNGTLDTGFGPTNSGYVTTSVAPTDEDRGKIVGIQSNGKIIVGGSKCTGACYFVLLRYNNTAVGINENYSSNNVIKIFPNPNYGTFTIQTEKGGVFELMDITGRTINVYETKNTHLNIHEDLQNGIYFIREKNSGVVQKLIVE